MKITLIRHGETDYNKDNIMQGISNIPLNDKGRRQCKKLRNEINDNKYDICFSSPLIRAVETAMILVGDKTEIKIDPRLIERNLGDMEGKTKDLYDPKKYWDYKLNSNDCGVERIQDMIKRVEEFVNYMKKNYKNKNILIVSHGAVIRTLHYVLRGEDYTKDLTHLIVNNCYKEEIEI